MDGPERIVTRRLVLQPVSSEQAVQLAYGDLSGLAGGEGWPHADTLDGARMAVANGAWLWFATLDGVIIGDCGTHGPVGADGVVEIGYALAGPYRGRGLGAEMVTALSRWLSTRPDVNVVFAMTDISNMPSRRCLEGAGFRLDGDVDGELRYVLERTAGAATMGA
ncbi:MAG: GNAT family N-acetyltransferase [Gaiellales bacterium]